MFIVDLIKNKNDQFNETDKQISKYILANHEIISTLSITTLAERTFTSKSTVLRFVQKLGFAGFTEFKFMISKDNTSTSIDNTNYDEITHYQKTLLKRLDSANFKPLFETISKSANIYLISTGLSQRLQAQTLQRDFLKAGIPMNLLPAGMNNDLSSAVIEKLKSEDLLIIFSSSGENFAIKDMLTIPLIKQVPIFSITNFNSNWLIDQSKFFFSLDMENNPSIIEDYSSTFIHTVIDYLRIDFERYLRTIIREKNLKITKKT